MNVRYPRPEGTHGYTQLFRSGFLESTYVLGYPNDTGFASLGYVTYEQDLVSLLRTFRAELEYHQIDQEVAVMVSLLRADRVELGFEMWRFNLDDHQGRFDRKDVLIPDILAPRDMAPELAMKPVFDLVWQAAGMERSFNYNPDGQWAPLQ